MSALKYWDPGLVAWQTVSAVGIGVPVGGTASQVLAKIDATDYNTHWVTPSAPAVSGLGNLTFTLKKASGIAVGKLAGFWTCPYNGTISAWNITADTGTITVKIWKKAAGGGRPTNANSINTAGLSLSSGTNIHSTILSDFTTLSVVAGDIFAMEVTAVAGGMTDVGGSIEITKT